LIPLNIPVVNTTGFFFLIFVLKYYNQNMLSLNLIRENRQEVISRLAIKNFNAEEILALALSSDDRRRDAQKQLDDLNAESNALAKEIGILFKSGKTAEANVLKEKTSSLKTRAKELEEAMEAARRETEELLVRVPNVPGPLVPPGKTPEDNKVVLESGVIPDPGENALPHWDLAAKYDIIDFNLGNKITGAGFPVYKGQGARLQRALINYFLDRAIAAGYYEIQPPLVVNAASGYGTGQLPDKDGQMYFVQEDALYLIPTAEVPVTNIYRDVILKGQDLPVKNVAYSACFRREAGSYGKDVRGLNRLHQFDKVEIVQVQHPDRSYQTLEEMKDYVAGLLTSLGLPFRILLLCGGDMSFTSAMTYDMEVYSAAQKRWLEVSSVSNFEAFQANRLKLRFRDDTGRVQPAHTLNGSALALPRIVAALLENNQVEDGILIPEVLRPYTGFDKITL
jgi:seryl-tRNA synthetase